MSSDGAEAPAEPTTGEGGAAPQPAGGTKRARIEDAAPAAAPAETEESYKKRLTRALAPLSRNALVDILVSM
jgi:hypothetical protein